MQRSWGWTVPRLSKVQLISGQVPEGMKGGGHASRPLPLLWLLPPLLPSPLQDRCLAVYPSPSTSPLWKTPLLCTSPHLRWTLSPGWTSPPRASSALGVLLTTCLHVGPSQGALGPHGPVALTAPHRGRPDALPHQAMQDSLQVWETRVRELELESVRIANVCCSRV